MADPGQLLAISLSDLNSALLSLYPSLTALIILEISNRLADETKDEIIRVHRVQNDDNNDD